MVESLEEPESEPARVAAMAADLRILLGQLRRRLREQADPEDFTWSQKSALTRLERDGPATVTALARAEGVRPQSMGATIATLEAAGLVIGAPDPRDGRQTLLSLTDACRDWIVASRAAREDWLLQAIQTKFSADEQAELARAVDLLKRLVSDASSALNA
jgi:DNA-binding MarR family transcriptional regulator